MFDLYDEEKWERIKTYFLEHPELGRIKSGAPGQSPEHQGLYLIKCTRGRNYVVSEQETGEFRVEPYELPKGTGRFPSF